VCVALISTGRGVFIGVQGGVFNLVKFVTRQVGGRPYSSASTDLQLGIPLYRLLESVTTKPTHEKLQGGLADNRVWPASHPLGPLLCGLCILPPHVRYTPKVTLILVEFQISL
jgi:hypothetical protein